MRSAGRPRSRATRATRRTPRGSAAQQLAQLVGADAAEAPRCLAAVEDRDLELLRCEVGLSVVRALQRVAAEAQRVTQRQALAVVRAEVRLEAVDAAADRAVAFLVLDRAVEADAIERVALGAGEAVDADLRHHDLHLERLDRARE